MATSASSCTASVDAKYELTNLDLSFMNPHLVNDTEYYSLRQLGCSDNRPRGQVCYDKPAIGSGLTQIADNYFLGLTDRGPNQDCEDLAEADSKLYRDAVGKKGKGFPLRKFAPSIVHFGVVSARRIVPVKSVPLRGSDGKIVSGLSNTVDDDTPYAANCIGGPLPLDQSGLDTEDIARIPTTEYVVLVDEYAPSVVVANYITGVIAARHVPRAKAAVLSAARYPIIGDIPNVYSQRRKNRGFESVVVGADGKYVIAILQSPMLDKSGTDDNAVIRCAYFDILYPVGKPPMLSYKRSFVIEASPMSAYFDKANIPKDIKYSAAQYYAPHKFVALERAKGQVKLFLVDFLDVTNIDNTMYADNLNLERATNGMKTVMSQGVKPAEKTLIWDSAKDVGGTDNWMASAKQEGFVVDSSDPTKVWMINDNDFGLERNGNSELLHISLGRSVTGATVCPPPVHPLAPSIDVVPTKAIRLVNSQTFRITDQFDAGAAENLDVDEDTAIAYVANDDTGGVDLYGLSTSPVTPMGSKMAIPGFEPTSVAICKSLDRAAIAYASKNESLPGIVQVTTKKLQLILSIENPKCFLPDSVKFSDDCSYLVAACEGEGKDIPGGVLVIDYDNKQKSLRGERFASFEPYDAIPQVLRENGVRLIESDKASLDLQPEFVSIIGTKAFITVQEANAIAVVDLPEAKISELKPIGFIERSRPGFALDASNRDGGINIRNYPFLFAMPQPDTITSYMAGDGETYLIFANEGDALESEEARGADITDPQELNRTAISGLKHLVEDDALLGRLKFSTVDGYNERTNTQFAMFHFGSRSFSIMALDGRVVFDSGEWFARIMQNLFPVLFNSNGPGLFDNRYVIHRACISIL